MRYVITFNLVRTVINDRFVDDTMLKRLWRGQRGSLHQQWKNVSEGSWLQSKRGIQEVGLCLRTISAESSAQRLLVLLLKSNLSGSIGFSSAQNSLSPSAHILFVHSSQYSLNTLETLHPPSWLFFSCLIHPEDTVWYRKHQKVS